MQFLSFLLKKNRKWLKAWADLDMYLNEEMIKTLDALEKFVDSMVLKKHLKKCVTDFFSPKKFFLPTFYPNGWNLLIV